MRFSICLRAASAGLSSTTRWTNTPGRCTSSGAIAPASTTRSASTIVSRPDMAAAGLKFRAAAWNTQLPWRSATAALTSATSATIDSSSTISRPWKVRTSLRGDASATLPWPSYFQGRPPSATSVPWGVSSTSTSPARYCRPNSLFSPTYDAITRRIRLASSSSPRPAPSTPQLLEMTVRSVAPWSRSASMRNHGMPASPKPPTAMLLPSGMSATASVVDATTLSSASGFIVALIGQPRRPPRGPGRRRCTSSRGRSARRAAAARAPSWRGSARRSPRPDGRARCRTRWG